MNFITATVEVLGENPFNTITKEVVATIRAQSENADGAIMADGASWGEAIWPEWEEDCLAASEKHPDKVIMIKIHETNGEESSHYGAYFQNGTMYDFYGKVVYPTLESLKIEADLAAKQPKSGDSKPILTPKCHICGDSVPVVDDDYPIHCGACHYVLSHLLDRGIREINHLGDKYYFAPENEAKVVVEVSGGVVIDERGPDWIEIEIIDYDNLEGKE